jgi:hypothetical protein
MNIIIDLLVSTHVSQNSQKCGRISIKSLRCIFSHILAKVPLQKRVCILLIRDGAHIIFSIEFITSVNDKFSKEWPVDVKQLHGRKIT